MSVTWTADMECALFYSMIDHKPVGENKHFHMIFIYEKFNNLNEKKLSTNQLWEHLSRLYDLQSLNENEVKPFPNDEIEFTLPESILKTSNQSSPSTIHETPKSVLKLKNNKSSSDSFFKETKSNLLDQIDTDRENSTTNSPKNESGSNLNSSSSQQTNQKHSINEDNNDMSSNEDASETSSKATRSVAASSKNESISSSNKKKKTNNNNNTPTTTSSTTKQATKSESKSTSKKRK